MYILFHSIGEPYLLGEFVEINLDGGFVVVKEPILLLLGPGDKGGYSIAPAPPFTNPKEVQVPISSYKFFEYMNDENNEIIKMYKDAVLEIQASRSGIILATSTSPLKQVVNTLNRR